MALFVDGRLLNVNNPAESPKDLKPYIDEFLKFKAYAQKLKALKFKRLKLYQEKNDSGGIEELSDSILIKYNQSVYDPHTGTKMEWRWTPSIPSRKDGEYKFNDVDASEWLRTKNITVNDIQKAFFLHCKSNVVNKYKELELVDVEKEADDYVNKQSKIASLDYFIFDEMSPLNLNPSVLKTIARAWGIVDVDKKTLNQLKITLKNLVVEGEKSGKKGINEFRAMLNLDKKTKIRSFITKAKEDKWIVYNQNKQQYCYMNADNEPGEVIINVSHAQGDVDDVLADYLISDDNLLKKFMDICQIKEPIEMELAEPGGSGGDEYSDENIVNLLRKPLMNKAIELNDKLQESDSKELQELAQSGFGTKSKEELLDFIKEHRSLV